jgi:hypothetical protein
VLFQYGLERRMLAGETIMTRKWFSVGLAVAFGAGCGSSGPEAGNPLTGTWSAAVNTTAFAGTVSLDFGADGSVTEILTATTILGLACSGSETTSGLTWSSSASTLTVGGAASCSGSYTCGKTTEACGTSTSLKAGTCAYALSNGNNTLTLSSCTNPSSDVLLTRM